MAQIIIEAGHPLHDRLLAKLQKNPNLSEHKAWVMHGDQLYRVLRDGARIRFLQEQEGDGFEQFYSSRSF